MYTYAHYHPMAGTLIANAETIYREVVDRSKRYGKHFHKMVDEPSAVYVIKELLRGSPSSAGLNAVVLNDSHLLVYAQGPLWFTGGSSWLLEQFYVRIGKGCARSALASIDELASDLGCTGIVMATSLAAKDSALGRLFESSGYSHQSSQFLKVL